MEAAFCIETLEDALARHGRPEIFNTDQGSQFTGAAFTAVLAGNGTITYRIFRTFRIAGFLLN
jgi:putative transposase